MKTDAVTNAEIQVMKEQLHADGLSLIHLGLMFIVIYLANRYTYYFFLIGIPEVWLFNKFRKKYTEPRIGYVKLPPKKLKSSIWNMLMICIFLVCLAIVLFIVMDPRNMSSTEMYIWGVVMLGLGLAFPVIMAIGVWDISSKGQYIDNGIIMVLLLLTMFIHVPDYASTVILLTGGGLNILVGTIRLIRFLKNNPVVNDEE